MVFQVFSRLGYSKTHSNPLKVLTPFADLSWNIKRNPDLIARYTATPFRSAWTIAYSTFHRKLSLHGDALSGSIPNIRTLNEKRHAFLRTHVFFRLELVEGIEPPTC